jgi:hypothetical protein
MSRQAKCAVTGEVLWGPKKSCITLRQGAPDECRQSSSRSGLACASDGGPPCSAAGWLQASRRAVSAGGGLPNGSKWLLSKSANNVAARRLVVAMCTPDELPQGKSSSDWLARCGPHLFPLLLAVPGPMGVGAAMVHADWLTLALLCQSTS